MTAVTEWRNQAECRDVTGQNDAIFFPTRSEQIKNGAGPARPLCNACPVWAECLKDGLGNNEFGTWGGLTENDRQWLKRNVPGIHKYNVDDLRELLTEILPYCFGCNRHRKPRAKGLCYSCWTRGRRELREAATQDDKELAA